MFNEEEMEWISKHSDLIESRNYDEILLEASDCGRFAFSARIVLAILYFTNGNLIIRLKDADYRDPLYKGKKLIFLLTTEPPLNSYHFTYNLMSLSETGGPVEETCRENVVISLVRELLVPEDMARKIVKKCKFENLTI